MNISDQLTQIPIRIIKEQELVIGPLAWDEASKVSGLEVNKASRSVTFSGDRKEAIDHLVTRYEKIFGKASHEVCKEAVTNIVAGMPAEEIPSSLR